MPQRKSPDASRRSERSRRAILEAALQLVGETGYARLTVEGIAARAGVGKQTIYRWWPSKEAVLLDAFAAVVEEAADGATGLPDTGDLEADLKLTLRATADDLHSPHYEQAARALAAAGVADAELSARFNERIQEPQLALVVARLRAAQEAGQLAPDVDLRVATEMLVGPLAHRWYGRTKPIDHAFTDRVVEQVLRGIGAR